MRAASFARALIGALGLAAILAPSSARAQETGGSTYLRSRVRAPERALELSPGVSYAQLAGDVEAGREIRDFAGSGVAPQLNIAYRATPWVALGGTGVYQELGAGGDRNDPTRVAGHARALSIGPDATFHFRPFQRVDPWARVGVGYRALWELREGSGNDVTRQGFEFARLALGLDTRLSPDVAIAPVLGGTASVFTWRTPENGNTMVIDDRRVSFVVHAGIEGRFDLGGQRLDRYATTARRPQPAGVTTITSAPAAPPRAAPPPATPPPLMGPLEPVDMATSPLDPMAPNNPSEPSRPRSLVPVDPSLP